MSSEEFKEPESSSELDGDWTYSGGLWRGWAAASVAGILLAVGFGALTHFVPPMTRHWGLNALWGLLMTHILFAVMHRYSGMVGQACDVGALFWVGVVIVTHYVVVVADAVAVANIPLTLAVLWDPVAFFVLEFATLAAAAFGWYLCRDGDNSLDYLIDILMTNPMTGMRG